MSDKLKVEYDKMTALIKVANCDANSKKITLDDFCK